MKIILSRKGFDSSYGGFPSPILPDGRLFSVPIPVQGDPVTYERIDVFGRTAASILSDQCPAGYCFKGESKRMPWAQVPAHFDPDLREGALPRMEGWRPLFGQGDAAQGHLDKNRVGVGDLFLFFGLFRETEFYACGRLRSRLTAPQIHLLFGWLEVGEVWHVGETRGGFLPAWARYHPHALWQNRARNNTVYVAAVKSAEGSGSPWKAGAFERFDPRLQLTAPGANVSLWRLPAWFYPFPDRPPLTYHGDPDRWSRADNHVDLQTVGKGQEFVLDARHYPEAQAWVQNILAVPTA